MKLHSFPRLLIGLSAFVAFGIVPTLSDASEFPTRPITIVVPYSPGGATDTQSRIIAKGLTDVLHQSVVVVNRPGDAGAVGVGYTARAKPDGYTIGMSDVSPLAILPHVRKNLPYNSLKDLDPLILLSSTDLVLVVAPSLHVTSVSALIQLLRAKPGKLSFASYGIGSVSQLAGVLFETMTKTKMIHVPYPGTSAAFVDLLPGRVPIMFSIMPPTVSHIKNQDLVALGVTGSSRNEAIPNVPTISEAGVPGYDVTSWFAFVLPHEVSKEIRAKLNSSVNEVLSQPSIQKRFHQLGLKIIGGSPELLAKKIRSEYLKWGKVVKDAGMKPMD